MFLPSALNAYTLLYMLQWDYFESAVSQSCSAYTLYAPVNLAQMTVYCPYTRRYMRQSVYMRCYMLEEDGPLYDGNDTTGCIGMGAGCAVHLLVPLLTPEQLSLAAILH